MNPFERTHSLASWLRVGLALIFGYAGVAKLAALEGFTVTIARLQLVPVAGAMEIAGTVALSEVLLAFWLLSGWRRRAAALAAATLAATFAVVVGQAAWRGIDFDCRCFGAGQVRLDPSWVVARAMMLLIAALTLRAWSVSESAPRSTSGGGDERGGGNELRSEENVVRGKRGGAAGTSP